MKHDADTNVVPSLDNAPSYADEAGEKQASEANLYPVQVPEIDTIRNTSGEPRRVVRYVWKLVDRNQRRAA